MKRKQIRFIGYCLALAAVSMVMTACSLTPASTPTLVTPTSLASTTSGTVSSISSAQ